MHRHGALRMLMRSQPARRTRRGSCGANASAFANPRSRRDRAPRSSRNRIRKGAARSVIRCSRNRWVRLHDKALATEGFL